MANVDPPPVKAVEIEKRDVLNIIKHCKRSVGATGLLCGLDTGNVFEVTNLSPLPSFDGVGMIHEYAAANYQPQLMASLADKNTVGWYQARQLNSQQTVTMLQTFILHNQNQNPNQGSFMRFLCIICIPYRAEPDAIVFNLPIHFPLQQLTEPNSLSSFSERILVRRTMIRDDLVARIRSLSIRLGCEGRYLPETREYIPLQNLEKTLIKLQGRMHREFLTKSGRGPLDLTKVEVTDIRVGNSKDIYNRLDCKVRRYKTTVFKKPNGDEIFYYRTLFSKEKHRNSYLGNLKSVNMKEYASSKWLQRRITEAIISQAENLLQDGVPSTVGAKVCITHQKVYLLPQGVHVLSQKDGDTCFYCLDELWGEETLWRGSKLEKVFQCPHVFHSNCMKILKKYTFTSTQKEHMCPICRSLSTKRAEKVDRFRNLGLKKELLMLQAQHLVR